MNQNTHHAAHDDSAARCRTCGVLHRGGAAMTSVERRSDAAVLAALDFSALCEHGNHKRGVFRPPARFWCARRCGCPGFLLCEQCLEWERACFRWVMEGCDGELAPQRWLRCPHCPRRGRTFDELIEVVSL
ncbi:hypothetical protein IU484_22875 [Nocardia farcinica]|uniref:hypothetical protein n=1 Tax=Nocardia farcinica TaxID=37329 RepID=UPI00189437E8|nr:hypothetical protein [Nocardia farcinica]MBF6142891.1 hypothetical protein [Nocardia farcinica]